MGIILTPLGRTLAAYLTKSSRTYEPVATSRPEQLRGALRPGDVLLVEGNTRSAGDAA